MRSVISLVLASFLVVVSLSACKDAAPGTSASAADPTSTAAVTVDGKCEHCVQKAICGRCNPALKPAFVAKNDWCEEHSRPESQCVQCHPEYAKDGVK